MKVSLVIPTYNNRERLELTLKSLEKQTFPKSDFEVVITNDGSTDGTREFLENYRTSLNLIVNHQNNSGQAKARNKAIQKSTGDIIIFVDDDVFCDKEFVYKHYQNHMSSKIPTAVIGKIAYIPNEHFEKVSIILSQSDYSDTESLRPTIRSDPYMDMRARIWEKDYKYVKWTCFTGANASVSRRTIDIVGMFDEKFYGWGPEDAELGYRLYKENVDFKYDDTILNYHMDKLKNPISLYSVLAKNLKYMKEEKYKNIKEIHSYISFGSCGISLEELNHICSGKSEKFNSSDYGDLYFFRPLDYFGKKSNFIKNLKGVEDE